MTRSREYELIIQNFSHSDGKRFLVEFISETGLNEGLTNLELPSNDVHFRNTNFCASCLGDSPAES